MTNFITLVKLILNLFPLIIELVTAIEKAFPEGGQGAAKLEMVKTVLTHAYSTATDITLPFETIWSAVSGAVGAVVSFTKK